ncbi:hypothetical protein [Streptomyces sp. 8N706]|uniref:hypothetical protein n=1 Tax=Streptomyces sp. 8N706 TaxID=3457416 RepID=UPI003FD37770
MRRNRGGRRRQQSGGSGGDAKSGAIAVEATDAVAGQALIPVLVAAREKILDREAYDSATSTPLDSAGPSGEPQPAPAAA